MADPAALKVRQPAVDPAAPRNGAFPAGWGPSLGYFVSLMLTLLPTAAVVTESEPPIHAWLRSTLAS
jgi:hypothetical protein